MSFACAAISIFRICAVVANPCLPWCRKAVDLVEVCDVVAVVANAAVEQNANQCFIKNSFLEAKDRFIRTEAFCNLTRFTFFTKFGLL